MKKLLFAMCFGAFFAADAKLYVKRDAIMSVMVVKDFEAKLRKFEEKMQKEIEKIEKMLTEEREAIESEKNNPGYGAKLTSWEKKLESYKAKVEKMQNEYQQVKAKAFNNVQGKINEVLAEISAKNDDQEVFYDYSFAYIGKKATNITKEFMEKINKKYKTVDIDFPSLTLAMA